MKISIVLTVKNERELLRSNLLYHRYLGVDEFFVFLDPSTDGTAESTDGIPGVTVADSLSLADVPERYRRRPGMKRTLEELERHACARQMMNSRIALDRARESGADWLISLDADELVCPSLTKPREGALKELFRAIHHDVEAVVFPPLEVFPTRTEYDDVVFREETLFKNRFAVSEGRFAPRYTFPREIYDPFRRETKRMTDYLGQTLGKSAVRTTVDALPYTPHFFLGRAMRRLRTQKRGWLLHYTTYSVGDMIRKYRNRASSPEYYVMGGSRPRIPSLLFRQLINEGGLSRGELEEYFKRWILWTPEAIESLRRRHPESVVQVKSVRGVLLELDRRPADRERRGCAGARGATPEG